MRDSLWVVGMAVAIAVFALGLYTPFDPHPSELESLDMPGPELQWARIETFKLLLMCAVGIALFLISEVLRRLVTQSEQLEVVHRELADLKRE